jgi:hypothetical protein
MPKEFGERNSGIVRNANFSCKRDQRYTLHASSSTCTTDKNDQGAAQQQLPCAKWIVAQIYV